ncbi:MAG: type II toxin-antitoxin system VapC family toxin [Actinomycetota bacterium]
MILTDTSVWVEFLRGSQHPARAALREILEREEAAIAPPIVMELLAGVPPGRSSLEMRQRLLAMRVLPLGLADYEDAAEVYRLCRRAGETVRSLLDCLIAVVAIREDMEVLHADRDFDVIARHTDLRVLEV